jgi:hypothetical protein
MAEHRALCERLDGLLHHRRQGGDRSRSRPAVGHPRARRRAAKARRRAVDR